MNITVVGNVIKDVYLNLDTHNSDFEPDKHNIKWLNLGFNASEHHFFSRNSSLGGAAVSLEVLEKMGLSASISGSNLQFKNDTSNFPAEIYRYILVADGGISYFSPSKHIPANFIPPSEPVDYLYIDRSASISASAAAKINAYLDISSQTKLIIYLKNAKNPNLNNLIPRANLVFLEDNRDNAESTSAPTIANISSTKIVHLSETKLSYQSIIQKISINRADLSTHLSVYSIASATILGGFILGKSVEESFALAHANLENSKLNSTLTLSEMEKIVDNTTPDNSLKLIAASLMIPNKGILAADESSGSIRKKFAKLNIPDNYETRRNYRNIFFTTPNIEKYLTGIILFDETARQIADNGQNYVDFLTSRRIIPGIKVDQGLAKFNNSLETYAKGLEGLDDRLREYYLMGLRFAKWRAAFEIHTSSSGAIITPTKHAISENCRILAEYTKKCQSIGLVPILEPEVIYDGYYSIEQNALVTAQILDELFKTLEKSGINLGACILKINMVIAGKNYPVSSTPDEVGHATAKVLKNHVPPNLAGIVFLSGGQTPEQATSNLTAIIKNGPFPWPITFSFARALQDPTLYAWKGNDNNIDEASKAFLARLIANTNALKNSP